MEPLISVIVPVYNVEEYLDRCLKSITNQSYCNLEIILVDDGSKDTSGLLCDEWAKKDDRISVIHKMNAGLGMARNAGIENCTGQYITFVDSDDFIEQDMYHRMVDALKNSSADTCYCSLKMYSNDENAVLETCPSEGTNIGSGIDILFDILGSAPECSKDCLRQMSVCLALFSVEIIKQNKVMFISEREFISEDLIFDVMYLTKAKRVVAIDECFYNYCFNSASLTHKYYSDRLQREKKQYKYICDLIDSENISHDYQQRYNRLFLGRIRNCVIQETNDAPKSYREKIKGIKSISSDDTVHTVVSEYPIWKSPIKQSIFHLALRLEMNRTMYFLAKIN